MKGFTLIEIVIVIIIIVLLSAAAVPEFIKHKNKSPRDVEKEYLLRCLNEGELDLTQCRINAKEYKKIYMERNN